MELINATRMVAGYSMGIEPSGQELLLVVIKGTFALPASANEPLRLAPVQQPLVLADTFTGAPGHSATVYEADFAPRKPRPRYCCWAAPTPRMGGRRRASRWGCGWAR